MGIMSSKTERNRRAIARTLIAMDQSWLALFGELGLSELSYSDLLTQMWLRQDEELHKTDLYDFMPNVSRRTAVKYVQHLIDTGLLTQTESAQDRRVRNIALTPPLLTRLAQFYDETWAHFNTEREQTMPQRRVRTPRSG